MTVYATVGYPGSGKGEAARVAQSIGLPVLTMGDEIRDECQARGLTITEDNLGQVASHLREQEGEDAIAKRCLPMLRIAHRAYGDVLVDGIRGYAEIERLETALGDDFYLIAVDAPFDTRLERITDRGRDPTASSAADLEERDEREEGYGMDIAFESADTVVDNSSSLESFRDALHEIFETGDPP